MSAKENFKIVSIKELTAIARALTAAKDAVAEAHEVLAVLAGVGKPVVKAPRTRRTKAEVAAAPAPVAPAAAAPVVKAVKKTAEDEPNLFLKNMEQNALFLKNMEQNAVKANEAGKAVKPNGALPTVPRSA